MFAFSASRIRTRVNASFYIPNVSACLANVADEPRRASHDGSKRGVGSSGMLAGQSVTYVPSCSVCSAISFAWALRLSSHEYFGC